MGQILHRVGELDEARVNDEEQYNQQGLDARFRPEHAQRPEQTQGTQEAQADDGQVVGQQGIAKERIGCREEIRHAGPVDGPDLEELGRAVDVPAGEEEPGIAVDAELRCVHQVGDGGHQGDEENGDERFVFLELIFDLLHFPVRK